jgi:hypothetical protein
MMERWLKENKTHPDL